MHMRRRKEELEREIVNLANSVAQGECSLGLRAVLVDRERQISEITARLLEARPDSLHAKQHSGFCHGADAKSSDDHELRHSLVRACDARKDGEVY